MKDQPTPLRVEKGRALDEYKAASVRLAKIALREMADMNRLRGAGADNRLRQAEISALVEFLVEKGLITTDEFLRRAADNMNKLSAQIDTRQSAIMLPGRH